MTRTVRSPVRWTKYSEDHEHGAAARSARANETVCCADVEFTPGNWPKNAAPLRYVAVRIRKRQGLLFASGCEQKFLAVVSNRRDIPAQDLLRWHWQKAGTIEHIHDVTKNELGAAPPSKHFGANAAWYRFSMLTYNVLSAMTRTVRSPVRWTKYSEDHEHGAAARSAVPCLASLLVRFSPQEVAVRPLQPRR